MKDFMNQNDFGHCDEYREGGRHGGGPRRGGDHGEGHGGHHDHHEGHHEGHGGHHEGRGGRGFGGPGERGGFGLGFPGGRGGFGGPFGGPAGPMGGFGMGPMGEGRGSRGGRRGPGRGRKGEVRNAVLALLREEQLNGYGLINAIADKSEGLWRPSAGSIYPALGLLEDEGLIEAVETDGKKAYQLTEAGTAYVSEHSAELDEPWDKVVEPHRGFLDVRGDMHQLGMAVQQVVMAGDADQVEATRKVLETARKDVYRLLAGDQA